MPVNNPLTGAIDVRSEPEAGEHELTPGTGERCRRRAVVEGVVVEVTVAPATAPPHFRALLKVPRPGSAVPTSGLPSARLAHTVDAVSVIP